MVDVVLGLQRGDEGKGRIVDLLAEKYDIVARFNGGANAGHTIVPDGHAPIALHQIPSGIAYPSKLNIIGNGVYLDPVRLVGEMQELRDVGLPVTPQNLHISFGAHLVTPRHKELDATREANGKGQGTTKAGIAFVAADKYKREGIRAESIRSGEIKTDDYEWAAACQTLKPYLADTVHTLHDALRRGKSVLAEGAQAYLLDIEHGMYPHVTSAHVTTGGVLNGLGTNHKQLGRIIGVAKVVKSHVGGGPFVTKITDDRLAAIIRGKAGEVDAEFGATTKRARHVGYFDLVELRSAIRVCGIDELVLTKMDCVKRFGPTMQVAVAYKCGEKTLQYAPSSSALLEACQPIYKSFDTWDIDPSAKTFAGLPKSAQNFVNFVEKELVVKVSMLGIGPARHQVISR